MRSLRLGFWRSCAYTKQNSRSAELSWTNLLPKWCLPHDRSLAPHFSLAENFGIGEPRSILCWLVEEVLTEGLGRQVTHARLRATRTADAPSDHEPRSHLHPLFGHMGNLSGKKISINNMQAKRSRVYHMLSNSEAPLIPGRHLGLNCATFVLDLFLSCYQVCTWKH